MIELISFGQHAHAHPPLGVQGVQDVPDPDTLSLIGASLALSAAATNALSFISVRALGKGLPTLTLTFWHQTTIACVASLSQLWITALYSHTDDIPLDYDLDLASDVDSPSASQALIPTTRDALLLFGIFAALLLAQVLQNRGLAVTSPSRGAAINVLQVAFCFMWDAMLLGHTLTVSSTVGGLLIVGGVVVLTSKLHATEPGDRKEKEKVEVEVHPKTPHKKA